MRLTYKSVIRIMDVLEEKISALQREKNSEKISKTNMPVFSKRDDEVEMPSYMDEEETQKDRLIAEYQEVLSVLNSELEKIQFNIGVQTWNPKNQPEQNPAQ